MQSMDWRALNRGPYIKAVEFNDRHRTITIEWVGYETLGTGKEAEEVGVIRFKGSDRGWVVNVTNAACIAKMFGPKTGGWIGKRVTLFSEMVSFGPKKVPGIRVFGSPDINEPIQVVVDRPKRGPERRTMQPTGKQGGGE